MVAFGAQRAANAFAFLCALVAFILSLLALFAGSSTGFLDQGNMISVNMSRIGQTPLFDSVNTTNCKRGLIDDAGDFLNSLGDQADCAINKGKDKINGLVSDLADSIADALHLPDFFDLHVMNFCVGKFEPADYLEKNITNPERNVTYCSPRTTEFSLELTKYVKDALPDGITLEDIKWPEEIPKVEKGIKTASRATTVFYAMGVGFTGLCTLLSLWGVLHQSGIVELANLILSSLGFFVLMIGGITSTVIANKAFGVIQDKGEDIGVTASKGGVFLGMTWAAVVLMFCIILVSLSQFLKRRKQKSSSLKRSEI